MSITNPTYKRVIDICWFVLILITIVTGITSSACFSDSPPRIIQILECLLIAGIICVGCISISIASHEEKQQKLKRQAAIASAAAIDTTLLYPQKIEPIKPQNSNSLLEQISKLSGVSEFELAKSVEEYNNHEKQSTDAS